MAIIYTYPIVTPQLQDLVVITDASDRNFTKQASIQDIIDLFYFDCTKCDYCTTSISEISPTAGDIVKALACDTGISFASSDASVIITGNNTTKTIDFKAVSGGGGGCPITYVLKPVYCKDGDCQIDTNFSKWIFSCDTLFADLSPGYIKDFTISGEVPGSDPCWYVEEATFGATASTCIECCPPAVLTFTSCDGIASISTLETNITGLDIDYINNSCWFITQGGTGCWNIETGGVDSGVAVVITASEKLEAPDCTCECCTYPCTFQYELCGGGPPDAPANINIDGLATADPCDISSAVPSIWYEYSTGNFACYAEPQKVCEAIDVVTYGTSGFDDECDHPTYCPPTDPTYTWENCDTSLLYTTDEFIATAVIGKTYEWCCDSGDTPTTECFTYLGEAGQPLGGDAPCNSLMSTIFQHDDCPCCLYKCVYEYTACPGNSTSLPNTIYYQVPLTDIDPTPCDCGIPPTNPVFDGGGGETWCYTLGDQVCVPPTPGLVIVTSADCEDPLWCPVLPDPYYQWKNCGDVDFQYTSEDIATLYPLLAVQLPFTGPFGDQMSTDCWDEQCCYTVEGPFPGPIPGADVPLPNTGTCADPNTATLDQDCDCCLNWDVVEYTACNGDTCSVGGYPTLYINVCEWGKSLAIPLDWKWDTAPHFIKIDTGSGFCCYEAHGQQCLPETLISGAGLGYSDLAHGGPGGWLDCTCGEIGVKLDLCGLPGVYIWATDTLSPGITTLSVGDVISHAGTCYEVVVNPVPVLGPISDLSGYTFWDAVAPLDPCECCNDSATTNNRVYTACEDGDPDIVINPAVWSPPLTTFGIDTDIKVEYTINPGVWHCYTYGKCTDASVTVGINDIQISTDCLDPVCDLNLVELTQCGGAYTETLSKGDIITGGLAVGNIINITGGPLAGIGITTCWEITNLNAPGPQTQFGASTYAGPIAASGIDATTACECCEQDLREYVICDAGINCDVSASFTIYIDVSNIFGYDPITYATIIAQDGATIQCCYNYVDVAPCQADTGTFIAIVTGCEDPSCIL